MKYEDTNIREDILAGIREMGFTDMTPIQEKAIPAELAGKDIVGLAQTGTGKTAAFGIPLIQKVDPAVSAVQGLVLSPTRELAMQDAQELEKMGSHVKGLQILAVYGGSDIVRQLHRLERGVQIVVGTPGRVMDLMRRKALDFTELKMLVLDEADEMLNMGFREDIETICQAMPESRQTALFSATMPDEIRELTEKYLKDEEMIEVSHDTLTVSSIRQSYYMVKGRQKDEAICRLIDYMSPKRGLIFCNTKRKVDQLTNMLKRRGYSAEALHGDLAQQQRTRVMELFRDGTVSLLLATDVAARGLDIDDVDIVFNYDLPQEMEYYVHRIGRTGRAGKKGKAVSLINTRERHKIHALEEYCGTTIKAKIMPSYADVMPIKANGNMDRALAFCEGMDLSDYEKLVREKCEADGLDPVHVAAAFLRQSLGEAREDIEIVTGKPERKSRKGGQRGGSQGRRSGGRHYQGNKKYRHDRSSSRQAGGPKKRDHSGYEKRRQKAEPLEDRRYSQKKERRSGRRGPEAGFGTPGEFRKRRNGKNEQSGKRKGNFRSGQGRKKVTNGKGTGNSDHYRRRNGRWSGRRKGQ